MDCGYCRLEMSMSMQSILGMVRYHPHSVVGRHEFAVHM